MSTPFDYQITLYDDPNLFAVYDIQAHQVNVLSIMAERSEFAGLDYHVPIIRGYGKDRLK